MAKRILIADDSLTIQRAFAMTFAGEDVTLLAARSAEEGLTMARQGRPELIIADAVMPGRSGYDLCTAVKSDPALRGVPVYILSSSQNPYDEARGRQSGADGQLTKPFESLALVERVKEAIARGVTNHPATVVPAARTPLAAVPAESTVPVRSSAALAPSRQASDLDDDYGEISIDDVGAKTESTPPPRSPLAPAPRPMAPTAVPGAAAVLPAGMRPSLIPGLRPGAPAPARPGMAVPGRPFPAPGFTSHAQAAGPPAVSHAPSAHPTTTAPAPIARAAHPPAPSISHSPARTLVGLPAAIAQAPTRFGAPAAPARPATQPVRPLEPPTPAPVMPVVQAHAPAVSAGPSPSAAITSKIDQKVAELAARGPEYEAIAKLSREIIEKIVWEVVPELAELIVREELQKRGRI